LLRQETKPKKATPRNTKAPALRTIESAAAGLASLKHPRRNPAPLVPRSGVFQGGFKKPYAKSVVVMLFRCLLMKNNLVSAYAGVPAGLRYEKRQMAGCTSCALSKVKKISAFGTLV
jgi:hypothetical protein